MRKIFKLNKTGALGVSIPEELKKAGFTQGMSVVWERQDNGFLLKLEHVPMNPAVPSIESPAQTPTAIGTQTPGTDKTST